MRNSLVRSQYQISLWQVKMCVVLAHMDLDNALLRLDEMSSSRIEEEKQCKDRKTLSHIHFHLSKQILQDVLKEKTAAAFWLK